MWESEEQFLSIIENLNAVLYAVDAKGVITYVSPSAEANGGYTPAELVGRFFTELVHPEDLPQIQERFLELSQGKETPIEARVLSKTGEIYWMLFHGKAVYEDGSFAGAQGVLVNVTEMRHAQNALEKLNQELEARVKERTAELEKINKRLRGEIKKRKRKEKQLQLLSQAVEQSSNGIAIIDLDGKVLYINNAFAESHGYSPGEVLGEHLSIFHNTQQMKQVENANRQIRENGEFLGEIWHTRHDGTVFPAMMHNSLLYDMDGRPMATIETLRDITEQKKMEQRLFQSEKLASLGYLASGIAHEINNPNSFIAFNVPILKDYLNELMPIIDKYVARNPGVEFCGLAYEDFRKDVFDLLQNIAHGSDRITSTVGDLREFARAKGKAEFRRVELREIFRKTLTMCRGKMNRMVSSFEVEMPEQGLKLHTDPEALEQVLINLLINGAQAADKGESWVKLRAVPGKKPDDPMIIEVTDNGCGMDDQTMQMIFDPFFTTKPVGESTGLGLSICHRLVEQIGGRIEVESEAGKGSRFMVILPGETAGRLEAC
ncbi:MAG: PAS domain S-box protein [Deltaproteobacteria bacterium]|nr:PAS domain S-box protein [Deltaproteobacteria bacterium]